MAVIVEVHLCAPKGLARVGGQRTDFGPHPHEAAVTIVAKEEVRQVQAVPPEAGRDEEIGVTIIVIVAPGRAKALALGLADNRERSTPEAWQTVAGGRRGAATSGRVRPQAGTPERVPEVVGLRPGHTCRDAIGVPPEHPRSGLRFLSRRVPLPQFPCPSSITPHAQPQFPCSGPFLRACPARARRFGSGAACRPARLGRRAAGELGQRNRGRGMHLAGTVPSPLHEGQMHLAAAPRRFSLAD